MEGARSRQCQNDDTVLASASRIKSQFPVQRVPIEGEAEGVAPAPPPWYSCHISSNSAYKIDLFDRLVNCNYQGGRAIANKTAPKRSSIAGTSRKARNRLLKLLAMVGRIDPAHFLTLTSQRLQDDPKESKEHLDRLLVRLAYHYPNITGVWRFAWQKRGSAHYHLLLWGLPQEDLIGLHAHIRDLWLKIIGERQSKASRKRAVDLQLAGDFRQCGMYLALYQANQDAHLDNLHTGRTWGTIHKDRLQLRPKFSFDFAPYQALFVRRTFRRLQQKRKRKAMIEKGTRMSGPGPLARSEGTFSAFMPVEEAIRLCQYVQKHVEPLVTFHDIEGGPSLRNHTPEYPVTLSNAVPF